ncbi:MAG: ATP-binding protein [Conexivisphaerales archaeon]
MYSRDLLSDLNSWWKDGIIPEGLVKPYRRKIFAEAKRLFDSYRQMLILTGLRRVGKSTIIFQLMSELIHRVDAKRILYFSFDVSSSDFLTILHDYQALTGVDWKKEDIFVFLDEVQKLAGWSGQVKFLYDNYPKIKIVLSGSASLKLDEKAENDLSGRYFLLEVPPLNLVEFYELKKGRKIDRVELYMNELKMEVEEYYYKPFPEIVKWSNMNDVKIYVREQITSKIVRSDLPDVFRGVNPRLIEGFLSVFYSRPGAIMNVDELARQFRVSKTTVENYLYYMIYSKLIRIVRNYRPSSYSESRKMKKVYPYNVALALSHSKLEKGQIYETIVAGALNAENYWRQGDKEVDFIQKEPLVPYEVKSGKDVSCNELRSITYFISRFDCKEGYVIYDGPLAKHDGITFLPLVLLLAS